MPAGGCNTRGFQPGRTCTDHNNATGFFRLRNFMRLFQLAPGRRVMQAQSHAALIDPVEAVIRAHARTDTIFLTAQDLGDDVRVGHVSTGHADHIELAAGDRMTRRCNILDLRGVECRKLRLGPDLSGQNRDAVRSSCLHRDQIGQRRIGIDMAPHDIEEVHQAALLEAA